jgi:hypothetical protein
MPNLFNEPYYEASAAPARLPESQSEQRLRGVLNNQAREVVSETVKRWNTPLRTEVRAVTALKLTDETGRPTASVPVSVVDGMPRSLADATAHVSPLEWWLALHRPALETANKGLQLLVDNDSLLAQQIPDFCNRLEAVENARALVVDVLKGNVEKAVLERFATINEDVLGAYWIHASRIQLYWMPLAIFAPLFDVSLATLTAVVLCHELVHAYTHRGIDIDGGSWWTDDFIKTNVFVKEGLAQFYTEHVLRDLRARLPDGLETFQKKTKHQAAPYTTYQDWLAKGKQPSPEATRVAMLEFRNAQPAKVKHEEFQVMLKNAEKRIRGVGNPEGDAH